MEKATSKEWGWRRQQKTPSSQGSCSDGLKLDLGLIWERTHRCPGAVPILAVHDEIVVECDKTEAEKVEAWLKRAMVDGMEEAINGSKTHGPRVPVEVETEVSRSWAA